MEYSTGNMAALSFLEYEEKLGFDVCFYVV